MFGCSTELSVSKPKTFATKKKKTNQTKNKQTNWPKPQEFYDSHKTFLINIPKYSQPTSLTSPPENLGKRKAAAQFMPLRLITYFPQRDAGTISATSSGSTEPLLSEHLLFTMQSRKSAQKGLLVAALSPIQGAVHPPDVIGHIKYANLRSLGWQYTEVLVSPSR